jgi:hypothetical protein
MQWPYLQHFNVFVLTNGLNKLECLFLTGFSIPDKPSDAHFRCSALGVGSCLTCRHWTWLKKPARSKHSSLLGSFVSCEESRVLWIRPQQRQFQRHFINYNFFTSPTTNIPHLEWKKHLLANWIKNCESRETLLNGKAQYSWPPCTN